MSLITVLYAVVVLLGFAAITATSLAKRGDRLFGWIITAGIVVIVVAWIAWQNGDWSSTFTRETLLVTVVVTFVYYVIFNLLGVRRRR